jgi:hypothetical protein
MGKLWFFWAQHSIPFKMVLLTSTFYLSSVESHFQILNYHFLGFLVSVLPPLT